MRRRLAVLLAMNPDEDARRRRAEAEHPGARIHVGEFGEWYADLPHGRSHAPTLDKLLRKLDPPPRDTG